MTNIPKLALMTAVLIGSTIQATLAAEPSAALTAVIEARSAEDKARDGARHPAQTLAFFSVEPGMTVAEALPGKGWYSTILANYLGADGALYGINYSDNLWPLFSWASDDIVAERIALTGKFPAMVRGLSDNGIKAKGFTFNTVPPDVAGKVDRVLMIRALHNLNRFESKAGTRTQALGAVRALLKSDGLVGVVQHRLPESADDAGADGSRGYLKQSAVIEMFEKAGFELLKSSEINANAKDKPGPEDIVWRLPPTLMGSQGKPEQAAAMKAIGESDRMTLVFGKLP